MLKYQIAQGHVGAESGSRVSAADGGAAFLLDALRTSLGKDEYAANLRWYYNMTAKKIRNIGVLRYVKHASV